MTKIYLSLLLIFSGICIFLDIKSKKIPNLVNVIALIILLFAYNFLISPIVWSHLFTWWLIVYIGWFFKIIGGGDAKMLFWLGIGIKTEDFPYAILGLVGIGIIYVGISLLVRRQFISAMINVKNVLLGKPFTPHKIIFSPVIALSMLIEHAYGWEALITKWTNYR